MSPHHRRICTLSSVIVLGCAVSLPTAFAGAADLRSPDSRDAHRFVVVAPSPAALDLRSPDTADLAAGRSNVAQPVVAAVDLRSPDTADLAAGGSNVAQPVVTIASPQGGFDWGDAGIGAGGAVAVLLLGLGAVLMTSHRRRGIKPPGAVAH